MDALWRIHLLGGLRAERESHVITRFRTQKTALILAYLAYYRDQAHPREVLAAMLWPECDEAAGRHRISVALSALRRQLELPGDPRGAVLQANRFAIQLNPDAVATDVAAFEAALEAAAGAGSDAERVGLLAAAIEGYGGELLPGCYEEWCLEERERLGEKYVGALLQWIARLERDEDLGRALTYARRAVSLAPLREEAHRELMRLLAASGQPAAALAHFRTLERLLRQQLDVLPSSATRRLAAEIDRGAVGALPRPDEPDDLRPAGVIPGTPTAYSAAPAASSLPAGTVTFLLADGTVPKTRRSDAAAATEPDRVDCVAWLREWAHAYGGTVPAVGSGRLAAFSRASGALACAIALQRAMGEQLAVGGWPLAVHDGGVGEQATDPLPSAVVPRPAANGQPPTANFPLRIALHTGEAEPGEGGYEGSVVEHVHRLLHAAQGGQILCSEETAALVARNPDPAVRCIPLGSVRLPGSRTPERLFQIEYAEESCF